MTVIELIKSRKLFQVAKELNLAHTTLMEFLNSNGFDTPKKHLNVVSQEMYEEIIKKFDQMRWRKHLEELSSEKEGVSKRASEDLREKELARILTEAPVAAKEIEESPPRKEKAVKTEIERPVEKVQQKPVEIVKEHEAPPTPKKIKEVKEVATVDEASQKVDKIPVAVDKEAVAEVTEEEISEDLKLEEVEIEEEEDEILKRGPGEMRAVKKVVEEALELARRKPKQKFGDLKEETEKTEEDVEKKKKRRRRRKKPRKPDAPSPAAIDIEKEKRAKSEKKKVTEEEKPSKKKRRRSKKKKVDFEEVESSIKETLAKIEDHGKGKKKKRRTSEVEVVEEDTNILRVTEFLSTQELANLMDIQVTQVIAKAMEMGLLISINQRLDKDTIELLTDEFGYDIEFLSSFNEETEDIGDEKEFEKIPRAPVVTVMGHVDHGKTSLLDYIRRSNIIAGESGGITQHIGAYKVNTNGKQITFLDTPGHEAFTAMRARGAQVTDIVVLVVAADDQVMPQTLEAIDHAQAAGVPLIVAINKIDKPNAQPEKVKQQLADRGILVEEWGGKHQSAEISAKFGQGVDKLMEEIILLADLSELKASVDCRAKGVVIDAKLDKGRGSIATILIQSGTLKIGDNFVSGQFYGRVRALLDERGKVVNVALPSDPVQVLGFNGTPQAGDVFNVVHTEREAKSISFRRQQLYREQSFRQIRVMTLDQISDQIKFGEISHLPLIIKGDVHGSVEALADSLMKIQNDEVTVEVIHRGVGAITESDVLLAAASGAIIIGFHVHANKKARDLSQKEKVEIKSYRIIYDVIEDIEKALEGMLKPKITEEILGEVEIRNIFKISASGNIAGCYVTDGKIERTNKIKVFRDGVEISDGELESLKRFKDDAREVVSGFECGIKIKNFNDIKVGDVIQAYKFVETKRTLND